MSEETIAKAQAVLDGSARGTDCKDVARACIELDQSLTEARAALARLARDHEAALATLTAAQGLATTERTRRMAIALERDRAAAALTSIIGLLGEVAHSETAEPFTRALARKVLGGVLGDRGAPEAGLGEVRGAAGPIGTLTQDEPIAPESPMQLETWSGERTECPNAATETAQGASFGPGTTSGSSGETSARPEAAQADGPVRVSELWAWSTHPAEWIVQVDRGRRQAVTNLGTLMTLREDGRPGDACWRRVP